MRTDSYPHVSSAFGLLPLAPEIPPPDWGCEHFPDHYADCHGLIIAVPHSLDAANRSPSATAGGFSGWPDTLATGAAQDHPGAAVTGWHGPEPECAPPAYLIHPGWCNGGPDLFAPPLPRSSRPALSPLTPTVK